MLDLATVPLLPLEAFGETFFVELACVTGIGAAADVPRRVPVVAWDERFRTSGGPSRRTEAKAISVRTPQGVRAVPADDVGRVRETPSADILPLPLAARSRCHPAVVGVVLSDEPAGPDRCVPAGWLLDPARLADPGATGGLHLPPGRLARRIANALPVPKKPTESTRCLVSFDAGLRDGADAVRFALSATQVVCLSPPQALTPVPTAAADLCGLVPWCGCPVPVIDLAAQFGQPAAGPPEMLLLARDHDTRELVGFPAAGGVELVRPSSDLRPIRCPFTGPAAAAFARGDRRHVVPRLSAVVSAAEACESAVCR